MKRKNDREIFLGPDNTNMTLKTPISPWRHARKVNEE